MIRIAKQTLGLVSMVLFGLSLTGCMDSSLSRLAHTQPIGAPFTASLAQEYLIFASRENTTYFDKKSASYFAQKGLDAAMGTQVQPELVEKWHIPQILQGELQGARVRLLSAINNATPRSNNSSELAQAQVNYDCWLEEQDENRQPENITFCRNNFYQAIMIAEQKNIGPSTALLPTAPYRSYYRPGQTDVPAQAAPVLNQLMSLIGQVSDYKMTVDGYADKTGKTSRNLEVSEQRANKMRDAVVARGAAAEKIRAYGHGDADAKGKRGTASAPDRRVDITLYVPEDYLMNMTGASVGQQGGGYAQGGYTPPQGAPYYGQQQGVPGAYYGQQGQGPSQRPAIPLMPMGQPQMMQPR